jgi:hypothetical protein
MKTCLTVWHPRERLKRFKALDQAIARSDLLSDEKEHVMLSNSRPTHRTCLEFAILVLFFFMFLAWLALSSTRTTSALFLPASPLSADVNHLWAQYSPYFPVAKYEPLPRGCKVSQVCTSLERLTINLIYFAAQGQHSMYLILFYLAGH